MEIKKIGFMFMVLMLTMLIAPVMAATPVPEPMMGEDGWVNPTGALYMSVMCHHNIFSKDVLMYRIADNNTIFFVNGALVQKETYDMVPKMMDYPKTVKLNEGGHFDGFFNPGSYALKLLDGNGGQPEYALVTLYQGGKSNVVFIGHAISTDHGEKKCVPDETFTIMSAKYGALGQKCEDISDNNAHTEYAFWITGTAAHTEYKYSDRITISNAHTEYQMSTYQVVTPEVPAWVEFFGNYDKDGSHYDYVGIDRAEYDVTFTYVVPDTGSYHVYDHSWITGKVKCTNHAEHGEGWHYQTSDCTKSYVNHKEDYTQDGDHFNYVGNDKGDYKVNVATKSGHTHHDKVDAVYGWVITTTWTDGICPMSVACSDKPGDTQCEERSIDAVYTWTDPSDWVDGPITESETRHIVDTRNVPDDMSNGEYSDWSDTQSDSCKQQVMSIESVQINEPCITREVKSTTHKECVGVGLYTDVTAQVQKLADDGINSFVFRNDIYPGGIFSVTGTLLAEVGDPAPGIVKTVEIVYNDGCSGDQTVTGNEYDVITFGTLIPVPK